jgi:four helix bundle protein
LAEISRFEDLEAWKLGRELARKSYRLTKTGLFAKDYGFADQIRRAAISVMNNIAEGFDRGTNKDFVKFLFIARGSAAEVRSMLYVALDQGYLSEEELEECRNLCIRCSQIIWGLIKSVRRKSDWVTGIK